MTKINVLLYGDGHDRVLLAELLNRAEPILYNKKEYTYVTSDETYRYELQNGEYDMVIVSAKTVNGQAGIQMAYEIAPNLPRIWILDDLNHMIDSDRLADTWFLTKPIEEQNLWVALERLLFTGR